MAACTNELQTTYNDVVVKFQILALLYQKINQVKFGAHTNDKWLQFQHEYIVNTVFNPLHQTFQHR